MAPHRSARILVPVFSFILALGAGAQGSLAPAAAPAASAAAPAPAETTVPAAAARLRILMPAKVAQGDPLLAWIVALPAAASPEGEPRLEASIVGAGGKEIGKTRCFEASAMAEGLAMGGSRLFGALMALPMDLAPGDYSLVVREAASLAGSGAAGTSAAFAVAASDFTRETIPLDEANTAIRTVPSKRKDDEARRLFALLEKTDDAAVYAEGAPFLFPVDGGFKSAGFGDRRRYVYAKGDSELSVHAGLDWAVVKGSAVRSCARGKVVLAADREVTGKSIVLEHLPGLYSLYFHLSSIEVKEGDIVERGQRIALSGSTGMSTGPHLHWELRAKGEAVDPRYWLLPALLDKEAIKATITALIEGR
jgi:murein DD-endopeptidase MepM/ murein hydrolase activator NlpD